MSAFFAQLHRMVLLAVLTVSLVATGFAHRLPGNEDQTLAAIAAAGATVADICGQLGGSGPHAAPLCQACLITGCADLPPVAAKLLRHDLVLVAEVSAPRENLYVGRVLDPSRTPQGPPLA
jgi:hypothetical protein